MDFDYEKISLTAQLAAYMRQFSDIPFASDVGAQPGKPSLLIPCSILPYLFEYPKRIKRNPFARPIALLNGPGTGDRTTRPASLLILSI